VRPSFSIKYWKTFSVQLGSALSGKCDKNRYVWSQRFVWEGSQKQNKQVMTVTVKHVLFSLLFNILNDNLHIPRQLLHFTSSLQTCTQHGHRHRLTVTRGCIDTICLSWWWARCARNM